MRWCNGGSSLSLESRTDNRGRAPAVLSRGYATSPAPPTTREYRTLARARAQHPCADDSRVRTEELELPGQMLVGELRGNWNAGPASRHCRADSTESSGMPSPSSPRRPVSAIETTTPRPGRSRRGALRLVAHCDGRGPPLRWRVVSWRTNSGASRAQTAEGSCRRSRPTKAPYLCSRRLSSAILGSMVELLDGWVVRGRGRGEGCGARGRPALSRSTIRGASGSAT
jgi:hypothetical protein